MSREKEKESKKKKRFISRERRLVNGRLELVGSFQVNSINYVVFHVVPIHLAIYR